jgi:HPt (histidine-containing phosphotransfer) domain-containing protein
MSDEPPPPKSPDNPFDPAFDPAEIEDLVNDLGPESVAGLLRSAIEDISARLAHLRDLPGENLAEGRALAHQLKGLFGQFGAREAAREAAALEACGAPQAFALRRPVLLACAARAIAWFEDRRQALAALG